MEYETIVPLGTTVVIHAEVNGECVRYPVVMCDECYALIPLNATAKHQVHHLIS